MDYSKELEAFAARRRKIVHLVRSGTPRSVVAKAMGISRQRVYQLTAQFGDIGLTRDLKGKYVRRKNGS